MKKTKTLTNDEVHELYSKSLIEFMELFKTKLDRVNEMTGTKHGFIMLMIRDPSGGNVDIASNLTTESLIPILEYALESAKNDLGKLN